MPPSFLKSLSLYADFLDERVLTTQAFAGMISGLTCLSVITPRNNQLITMYPLWNDVVGPHLLPPTMGTLMSLTLHPDILIGGEASIFFPSLFFPRLTHLSLKMFLFEPTNNLEDFIVRHGVTLTHLRLESCSIITRFSDDTHPNHSFRHQSDIWNHFADKLKVLIEVTVLESWNDSDLRYMWHAILSRYVVYSRSGCIMDLTVSTPERLKADDAVLDNFKAIVVARHGGLCI
jgi:hypothetical protein